MLVIVSDLHFCDNTLGRTISAGAFEVFRATLANMAYSASWRLAPRKQQRYEPVRHVDIVLLGDVLDLIRSTTWIANRVRPWSKQDDRFCATVMQVAADVLDNNEDALAALRRTACDLTLPAAVRGKPSRKRQPVDVRVHYVVGNHDWFLHLPDRRFNALRRRVKDAMGLCNNPSRPFPHDPSSSPALRAALSAHDVVARHGDKFDPINFHGDRKEASVGDAVVVELVCGFFDAVNSALGSELGPACLSALREVDNVRPATAIPKWIFSTIRRTCHDPDLRSRVERIWKASVAEFLNLPIVQKQDRPYPFEQIDRLQSGLRLSQVLGLSNAAKVANLTVWDYVFGRESYAKHALNEPDIANGTARFVVYGHTHHHEIVPIQRTATGIEQFYINSGTWRRINEIGERDRRAMQFLDYNVMTTVAFYKGTERKGRRFEVWTGALDNVTGDLR